MRLRGAGTRRGRGHGVGLTIGWRVLSVLLVLLGGLSLTGGVGRGVAPVAAATTPLALAVTASDPLVGGNITYTLTVKNEGNFPVTGTNPNGRAYNLDLIDTLPPGVTYVSTTAPAAPTITVINPGAMAVNQQQKLTFTNLTDIVVGQTYTIDIVGKLNNAIPPQTTPTNGLTNVASAQANANPRLPGDPAQGSGDIAIKNSVLPFQLTNKAVQSTGVNQATGGVALEATTPVAATCAPPGGALINRAYEYALVMTNNAVGISSNLQVVDTLPYGVVYCGAASGSIAPAVTYNADGTTTLTYTLPNQNTNGTVTLKPQVAIPYTYPKIQGTTTITNPLAGQILNDDLPFKTTATLTGTYASVNYSTGIREVTITAKRTTIAKSGVPDNKSGVAGSVVQGSRITYTLVVATSDYYDASNVVVTDTLPNGQIYVPGLGTPPDTTPVVAGDGTTLITWSLLAANTTAGTNNTITFYADVRTDYASNSAPVVSADTFSNTARVGYTATTASPITPVVTNNSSDNASAGQPTSLPTFSKTVTAVTRGNNVTPAPTDGGVVNAHEARATVGDIVTFQLDFATGQFLDAKDIVLTDILPPNYRYVPNSSTYSGSYVSGNGQINNVTPVSGTTEPKCDAPCGPGALLGYELTGVSGQAMNIVPKNTTVRITLRAQVVDYLAATPDNLGKVSGDSTTGTAYSLRDTVKLTTLAPLLTINKSNTPSTGVQGGQIITYSVTVTNGGNTTAFQIADLVDTFPTNIRYCDSTDTPVCTNPTITPATTPAPATLVTPVTKAFNGTVTFNAVQDLAPGQSFTITYQGYVRDNPSPVVGTTEINNANIASYSSQPAGVTVSSGGSASGQSSVRIGGDVLSKDAALVTPSVDTNAYSDGTRVTIGDVVTYTLNYTLAANTQIYKGEIRECLPYGFRYITSLASDPTYAGYTGTVTSGSFPNAAAIATTPGQITTRIGQSPCANTQQELLIPLGDQDNTGRGVAVLTMTFKARVTGTDINDTPVFTATNTTYFDKNAGGQDNFNRAYFFRATTPTGTATEVTTARAQSENSGPTITGNVGRNNRIYVPRVTIALSLNAPTTPKWTGDGTTTVVPLGPTTNPTDSFVNYRLTATNHNGSRAFNVADLVDTLPVGLQPVGVYAGFAGDGSCNTAAVTATINGQIVSVPVNLAATIPNSLGAGESYTVCVRAKVTTTTPSLTLTDTLDLARYASAPTGVTGRREYGALPQLSVPVRTQDILTFTKPADKTYGDAPVDLTASMNSTGNRPITLTVLSGPCVIDPVGSKTVRITGAGTCTLRASQNGDNLAPDVTQSFVIAKAVLTVKVNDQTRPFGETTPIPCVLQTGSPSVFVNGDDINDIGGAGALSCATTAAASTTTGRFPLTPSGFSSDNYNIRYTAALLTITPRPVTPVLTITPTPLPSGQSVTLTATIPTTPSGIAPRGSIQFWVSGRLIASVQVTNGKAEYTYKPNLAAGSYPVEVRYLSTDSRFVSSGSVYSTLVVR